MRLRSGTLAVLAVAAGLVAWALVGSSSGRPSPQSHGPTTGHVAGDPSGPTPPAGEPLSAIGPAAGLGVTFGPSVSVGVSSRAIGQAMKPSFLGLSLEYFSLSSYVGDDPAHPDPVLVHLIRDLAPGQPPVLRIGGDSTDRTWWPIHGVHVSRAVNFALSQRWLSLAHALASRTDARLILGINLAAGNRRLAMVEARHLVSGVGRRHIAALEIGNEPDDYPVVAWDRATAPRLFARPSTYGVNDYLRQFNSWAAALPHVPVAGPALARTQWMPGALHALLHARHRVSLITFHRYPLRACEKNPQAGDYPTIPRLLSDASSAGLTARVAPYVKIAHAAGRPFRLDELNSVSCKGKFGVSNTFAAALWAVDTLFDLSAAGVDGVNFHMLPGSAYQAFSVARTGGRWSARVAPLYYGLLMFSRAFPPGARLLSLSAPSGSLKAWATRGRSGRLRVALINENPLAPVTVRLRLPGRQLPLSVQRLLAPSVSATAGVSLGGVSFGSSTRSGILPAGPERAHLSPAGGYYSLSLPGGSAALLTG